MTSLLIVGRDSSALDALSFYKRTLRRELGLRIDRVEAKTLEEIGRRVARSEANIALVTPWWGEDEAELIGVFSRLADDAGRPKLVFFDPYDSSSSPFLAVTAYVDLYVKSFLLRDLSAYDVPCDGGSLFMEYLQNEMGVDLRGYAFGSTLPPKSRSQLFPGWNFAVHRTFRRLALWNRRFDRDWSRRTVDLHCRFSRGSPQQDSWYRDYRNIAMSAALNLRRGYSVAGPEYLSNRPPRWNYYRELRRSKLVFSPFGSGEVCLRDYEAVCFGCLLVKPSVDHIQTKPNIFRPHETYVPVRWDFADLEEVCAYYLSNAEEGAGIARNAQRVLASYHSEQRFVSDFAATISSLRGA